MCTDSYSLGYSPLVGFSEHSCEPAASIKGGKFLNS
jgi:hypothetical protein